MNKPNQVEVVETLTTIISTQSGVINELFMLLSQHISAEELDEMEVIKKINTAVRLRRDME